MPSPMTPERAKRIVDLAEQIRNGEIKRKQQEQIDQEKQEPMQKYFDAKKTPL